MCCFIVYTSYFYQAVPIFNVLSPCLNLPLLPLVCAITTCQLATIHAFFNFPSLPCCSSQALPCLLVLAKPITPFTCALAKSLIVLFRHWRRAGLTTQGVSEQRSSLTDAPWFLILSWTVFSTMFTALWPLSDQMLRGCLEVVHLLLCYSSVEELKNATAEAGSNETEMEQGAEANTDQHWHWKHWQNTRCVSNNPGNTPEKNPETKPKCHISKHFHTLMIWLFRHVNMKVYHLRVMETFFTFTHHLMWRMRGHMMSNNSLSLGCPASSKWMRLVYLK